ncbi:MAG: DNA replication protein DnaD [Erysipelotrichaceae bacterium]|nr:DNA replication protein DnaD [Erysipelotrichaceae bacterium]
MLKEQDRLKLECVMHLHEADIQALHLLYGPLIGDDALLLYGQLYALHHMPFKIKNHLLLHKLRKMSMERLQQARIVLEQYLLLKTYYHGSKNEYVYVLCAPKSGMDFLNHEVFGRLYLKEMGKQVYEYMKKNFSHTLEQKSEYQDITTSMRKLLSDWNDKEEESFSTLRPDIKEVKTNFRFDLFLNGLSTMIFPLSERTKENLTFIAEKADLYGIDEKEMQKLVGRSMDLRQDRLDQKKLISLIQKSHQEYTKVLDDPYAMPPVRFLQAKQRGIAVSNADKKLIDDVLSERYQLKPEVINVLIEYVLERCHQEFRKSYVEKVAATWVRLEIDTKEKALSHIQEEPKENTYVRTKKEKQLPKWFHDQDSVEQEQEEDIDAEKLMERLRKLGEQHG